MGALQKIRSKSTLLVGIIAVGLLAFVVPWGEISQFINVSKDKAFVVNGDVVKTRQYAQRIEQRENIEKQRARNGQLTEQQVAQIREEVYQTISKEMILDEQAEKLGIAVSKAELNDMVYGQNVSPVLYEFFSDPQTGQLNRAALNEFLTEINKDYSSEADAGLRMQQGEFQEIWSFIENRMKYTRLEEKYASLVAGSVLVNDIEAKTYFDDSNVVSDLAYVSKDYSSIDDSTIEVSDVEIQDLYNIRKENFLTKLPSSHITYFVKNIIPSDTDYEEVEKQMEEVKSEFATTSNPGLLVNQYSSRKYVDAHIAINSLFPEVKTFIQNASVGEVYGPVRGDRSYTMYKYVSKAVAPDSIKMRVLPIQSFDQTLAASLADSLQNVLKGGKDFATLAQEMYPNMQGAGEADWYNEEMLSTVGIAEKCFGAPKGSVLKVEINGMTSLVKIDDATKPVQKAKIAEITMPVIVSDRTNNAIDNEINKFLSENKNPAEFEKAALNSGYDVISNAVIYPNFPGIDNTPGTREIIRWAFNEAELNVIKKFETNEARIVAMVTDKTKEGYLPATNKEVKEVLKAEILKEKKAKQIISDLESKSYTSLSSLAEAIDAKVDTARFVTFQTNNISGVGYEPAFNVYSKLGEINKVSAPLKGNKGVFVLNVANKNEESAEYNKDIVKSMINSNQSQMLSYYATFMLMNKMDIEDNRIVFY